MNNKSTRRKTAEPSRKITYVQGGNLHRVETHDYIAKLVKESPLSRVNILNDMVGLGCKWSASSLSLITDLQNGKMKLPLKDLVYFINALGIKSKKEKRKHILRILLALVPENLSGYVKQVDVIDEDVANKRCFKDKINQLEREVSSFKVLNIKMKLGNEEKIDKSINNFLSRCFLLELKNNEFTEEFDEITILRCKNHFKKLLKSETHLLANLKPEQPILPKIIELINISNQKERARFKCSHDEWEIWRENNLTILKKNRQELTSKKLFQLKLTKASELSNTQLQQIEEDLDYQQEIAMYDDEQIAGKEYFAEQFDNKLIEERSKLISKTRSWLSSLSKNECKDLETDTLFEYIYSPYHSSFSNDIHSKSLLDERLAENNNILPHKIMKLARMVDTEYIMKNREQYHINSLFDFTPDYVFIARLIKKFNKSYGTDYYGKKRTLPYISLEIANSPNVRKEKKSKCDLFNFDLINLTEEVSHDLLLYIYNEIEKIRDLGVLNDQWVDLSIQDTCLSCIEKLTREFNDYLKQGQRVNLSFWDNLNLSYPEIEGKNIFAKKLQVAYWFGSKLPPVKSKSMTIDESLQGFDLSGHSLSTKSAKLTPTIYSKGKVENKEEITLLFEAYMMEVETAPHLSIKGLRHEVLRKNKKAFDSLGKLNEK